MSEANTNPSEKNLVPFSSLEENIDLETTISNEAKEKDIDWHKLAHKLREHNRKLLKQVFQLEQALIESDRALEDQKEISRSQDLLAAKQAEKINRYQVEIDGMLQKIEAHERLSFERKTIIKTLTLELETSQKKATKLETECTELMVSNEAKDRELQDTKQKLQELNIRYNRQQQHLLKSKTKDNGKVSSQPIKAWSADPTVTQPAITATNSGTISDWPSPAIAETPKQIESIAAVQLPKFSRQAEGE
jgi:hypothetical protein